MPFDQRVFYYIEDHIYAIPFWSGKLPIKHFVLGSAGGPNVRPSGLPSLLIAQLAQIFN